ncbi:MAG: hypothetical protein E7616_07045 [Ruminococcaceae bacterium]|nr:hypothetical protein [Oscillospiraceae bacterium]
MKKHKRKTGKIVFLVFLALPVLLILFFTASCRYNPPEGYTKEHHTYGEILAFAKSLDPDAVVSENYTDTQIDAWNRRFREWDAVINGIECHVSSVGDMVWDSTGEFAKQYYVIDTDYDYLLLQKIVSEKQPDWEMKYTDIASRYNWNNFVIVQTSYTEKRKLSSDELETAWSQAFAVYQEYNAYPVRKKAKFSVAAPAEYGIEENCHIKITSDYMEDFSDQGKAKFFENYEKAWDLIDSGLPIKE